MRVKRAGLLIATLLVASLIVGACSGADSGGTDDGSAGGTGVEPAARAGGGKAVSTQSTGSGSGGGSDYAYGAPAEESDSFAGDVTMPRPGTSADLPAAGPAVIKTARLDVRVPKDDVQSSIQDAMAAAERYGGFVFTTETEDTGLLSGWLVLRVPAESFGRALQDIHELGDVKRESVTGQDVSQEFVDLQARLRNYSAQEAVLLKLMNKARSVSDTIRVQNELQRVQLEVERLRGRLNFLEDQTDMGTINVRVIEAGAAPSQPNQLVKAFERALDAAMAVVTAVIVGAGVVVPLAILLGLAILVVVRLRPRLSA